MKDDHPFDGPDPRMTTLIEDLPAPKNRGLFRRAVSEPDMPVATAPVYTGPAQLRIVTSGFDPDLAPVAGGLRLQGDFWSMLRRVDPGANATEYHNNDRDVVRSFDLLRTRLLKSLRAQGWSRVAIAAPTAGCGATFAAVHLAKALAGVPGERTLLMDLNLHRPGLARAFGIAQRDDMRGFLARRLRMQDHFVRLGDTLAVGLARPDSSAAAGILNSEVCASAIGDLADRLNPDVMLFDLPPMLERDDLAAFLPQVDGVIMVADATRSLPEHVAACETLLKGQTRILGVVLNQTRRTDAVPADV